MQTVSKGILFLLGVVLTSHGVMAESMTCTNLGYQSDINLDLFSRTDTVYYTNRMYFCGENAPEQLRCTCPYQSACQPYPDPWGRNIGICRCCSAWIIYSSAVFGCCILVMLAATLYAAVLRGKWWLDGYPQPISWIFWRRGRVFPCPPDNPLPRQLFKGFDIAHFVNYVDTDDVNESAQRQRSRGRSLSRRRHRGFTRARILCHTRNFNTRHENDSHAFGSRTANAVSSSSSNSGLPSGISGVDLVQQPLMTEENVTRISQHPEVPSPLSEGDVVVELYGHCEVPDVGRIILPAPPSEEPSHDRLFLRWSDSPSKAGMPPANR